MNDALGDRMKRQYEDRTRILLPRRTYTILRVDGKAFHTFTRNMRWYDLWLVDAMDYAASRLCEEAQGARFGYVQSDEISVVLTDFQSVNTDAWFDGNLQKIVSVAASIVTEAFNATLDDGVKAHFDCRAFTIPDPIEVENYFIWRQQDATRNSIQSFARQHFSHKALQDLNSSQIQEKLHEIGLNSNDLLPEKKRGRGIVRTEKGWQFDTAIPVFTQDREYLKRQWRIVE